jgi:hypothetical protein
MGRAVRKVKLLARLNCDRLQLCVEEPHLGQPDPLGAMVPAVLHEI